MKIYHNSWVDDTFKKDGNYIYNNSGKYGTCEFIFDFLIKINWENNENNSEYFFTNDWEIYYQETEKFIKKNNDLYEYISINNSYWNDICLLNKTNKKIYKKSNYYQFGDYTFEETSNKNILTIKWNGLGEESFIFHTYYKKYYSFNYFYKLYEKIYIIDTEKDYYLCNESKELFDISLYHKIKYKDIYLIENNIYTFKSTQYFLKSNKSKFNIIDEYNNHINNIILNDENIMYHNKLFDYKIHSDLSELVLTKRVVFKRYIEDNCEYYCEENIYNEIFNDVYLNKYDDSEPSKHHIQKIILHLDKNIFYDDKFTIIGEYIFQENELVLYYSENDKNSKKKISYRKFDKSRNNYNNYYQSFDDYMNITLHFWNDSDIKNTYFIIINYKDLLQCGIDFVEYLIENNKNIIVIDNIKNREVYKDLNKFNIIYFENDEQYHKLTELILECHIIFNNNIQSINPLSFINPDKNSIEKWKEINPQYDLNEVYNEVYNKIPKIFHFIWIGKNTMPPVYLEYIESWIKLHPDYQFCIWNDDNIPKLLNQDLYDSATHYAMKADILRYELLYVFGGIYIDCDFWCIRSIDKLIRDLNLKGFSAYESDEFIAIGIMGFRRGHDFLLYLLNNIEFNIFKRVKNNQGGSAVPDLTGPKYFTHCWLEYIKKGSADLINSLYAFSPEYFYKYTFQDKMSGRNVSIDEKKSYAVHMWGYSWKTKDTQLNDTSYHIKQNNIMNLKLKNLISGKSDFKFDPVINHSVPKIIHVIGLFFSGGIERLIYYFDKYGDKDKYKYYILCYGFGNKSYYKINDIDIYSFDGDHQKLNTFLQIINPNIIIDHYSFYTNENKITYSNINFNKIIYFIHSAILYNKNIDFLSVHKCIHLYEEPEKEASWNRIRENYYVSLGCDIVENYSDMLKNSILIDKKRKMNISIVGRVTEEKIPLRFFKLLCELSLLKTIDKKINIQIYGEKDTIFNREYVEKFDEMILKSNIKYCGFIEPESISEVYKNTDVILISSEYETGSFVCVEAYTYGIPVIARNVFGLKKLIRDEITGFLCESDNHILDIIKKLKIDTLEKMRRNVLEEAKKYNIKDKIKDIEKIIDDNLPVKNIIIITSVINCPDKELTYYGKRSVFTTKTRYKQTLKTVESIRKYIPNVDIFFTECSDMMNYGDYEDDIRKKVDYYFNFYNDEVVKRAVYSGSKGWGETELLLASLEKINQLKMNYKYLFKISGRYYLNDEFNYENFNNNLHNFTLWDNSNCSFCTLFYKILYNEKEYFESILMDSLEGVKEGISIELCFYKKFIINRSIVEKMNVSGYLSTEGYFFSI